MSNVTQFPGTPAPEVSCIELGAQLDEALAIAEALAVYSGEDNPNAQRPETISHLAGLIERLLRDPADYLNARGRWSEERS